MRRGAFAALIALAALAGCDRGPVQNQTMSANEVASELRNVRIRPGQWEMTSEIVNVSAEGLPREVQSRMLGRRTTIRNCITPAQAARPDANFLAGQANGDCTYSSFSMADGRMRGAMACGRRGSPQRVSITMDGTYRPEGYDMNLRMQTEGMPGNANMAIETRAVARRVGECTEGDAAESAEGETK